MHPNYDYLVIGSGIAGLSFAIKMAEAKPKARIAIVTKSEENESNTRYAQGGIAIVTNLLKDSYREHIQDTLTAGDGQCIPEVVEMVVKEAPQRLEELIQWGVDFDKKNLGEFDLGLEGGHSTNRILHHKDITGFEIGKKLIAKAKSLPNVSLYEHHFAIDLITQHHLGNEPLSNEEITCFGAYVMDQTNGEIETFSAHITLMASGGAGQIYQNTTNPSIATGDGIAMAYRAKARIKNMEFIQFHPTALDNSEISPRFLISEAVRGFGAYLRNGKGKRFMSKYDERLELAPRDIVSRAIDSELKKSGDQCVFLDCRHLDIHAFQEHFPTIYGKMKELGKDLTVDQIPVVPAAHYLCGGIEVNKDGQTSLRNLFASGEVSCTGLHGSNRLASNSLLEALVYSHRSYASTIEYPLDIEFPEIPDWNASDTKKPEEMILITHNRKELQLLMRDYVGIIRTPERLQRTSNRLQLLYAETENLYQHTKLSTSLIELRNMISVAYLVVQQSIAREENCGVFYKTLRENS